MTEPTVVGLDHAAPEAGASLQLVDGEDVELFGELVLRDRPEVVQPGEDREERQSQIMSGQLLAQRSVADLP